MAYTGLGKIALSKTRVNPYNMDMKNTKAVFLIILGSFLLATGFAYAKEDGPALAELKNWAGSSQPYVALDAAGVANKAPLTKSGIKGVDLVAKSSATVPAVTAPAKEEKKPTLMESAKKWTKENFSLLVSSAAIGFLGFLILGTGIGGLLVGLAFFGFVKAKDAAGA